jgi:hypothetical protein
MDSKHPLNPSDPSLFVAKPYYSGLEKHTIFYIKSALKKGGIIGCS